jgi:hypothetical protein
MSDELETQGSELARRDFLKRSAIVGGMVWAAPLIQSAPAFASEGTPDVPGKHAISYLAVVITCGADVYQVKYNAGGQVEYEGKVPWCDNPDGWQEKRTTNKAGLPPEGSFSPDTAYCWSITVPSTCTLVGVAMGAGGDKTDQGFCVEPERTSTNGGNKYKYTFCSPS